MSLQKKENANKIVLSGLESFQRMALGFMPGGHVIEEFLNFRTRLKQERILCFADSLSEFFKECKNDIPPNEANYISEDFVDIFEAVINKVQTTNSSIKLEYFRNLVINQLTSSSANDILSNKIIQTVDELNDIQLVLLMLIFEEKRAPTIYDLHLKFQMKNVYIRLSEKDELPSDINTECVFESSIFVYFLDELVRMGLIEAKEIDGEANIPTRELKDAYQNYVEVRRQFSNSRIVYICSSYGALFCKFLAVP